MEHKVNLEERCPTGIEGLDKLIEGGFPRGRTILVSGKCGTGKTIFASQFLYNGAAKYNENGILLILEQNVNHLRKDLLKFNIDLKKMEDEGKIVVIDASLARFNVDEYVTSEKKPMNKSFSLDSMEVQWRKEVVDIISNAAKEINAKRAVVDSLPALDNLAREEENIRDVIINMNYRFQGMGLTTVLVDEITNREKLSTHAIEEYITDGVISLHYDAAGPTAGRNLMIHKMRGTKHSEEIHPIKFKEGHGVQILGIEDVL